MKKTKLDQWRQLPTTWVHSKELRNLRWPVHGGEAITCLMLVLLMAQRRPLHSDGTNGMTVEVTYDEMQTALGRPRATISAGLKLLLQLGWIRKGQTRSQYVFTGPDRPWGKVPASPLYDTTGFIKSFEGWTLRNYIELDAMKLYFVLVAFRDTKSNQTRISYSKLNEYSGVGTGRIKGALSLLVASHLLYVERGELVEFGTADTANAYRLRGVDPYKHLGTADPATITQLNAAE